jgi:hypothetical protein
MANDYLELYHERLNTALSLDRQSMADPSLLDEPDSDTIGSFGNAA